MGILHLRRYICVNFDTSQSQMSLFLSGATMPERAAGDMLSSDDETSSYEEVPEETREEAKPAEPEPEQEGESSASEDTASEESTGKREVPAPKPEGRVEVRSRVRPRSPEAREGRPKRRSPVEHVGRPRRPRSPSAPAGGKAKGKSKGKKGAKAQEYTRCGICRQAVKNTPCSQDQHRYWSTWCNTWRRYNAGMSWDLAQAAAERQKRRRERREQRPEERPVKHHKEKEPSRKERPDKKKGDKKGDKKKRKTRPVTPSPEPARPAGKRDRPPSSSGDEGPRSHGVRKQWTKVFHWVKLWSRHRIPWPAGRTCGSIALRGGWLWAQAFRSFVLRAWTCGPMHAAGHVGCCRTCGSAGIRFLCTGRIHHVKADFVEASLKTLQYKTTSSCSCFFSHHKICFIVASCAWTAERIAGHTQAKNVCVSWLMHVRSRFKFRLAFRSCSFFALQLE